MFDPKILDDMAKRMAGSMPVGVGLMQDDLRRNLRALLESALARMKLVTREEFDAQAAVLARTRDKLERLEVRVQALESVQTKPGE